MTRREGVAARTVVHSPPTGPGYRAPGRRGIGCRVVARGDGSREILTRSLALQCIFNDGPRLRAPTGVGEQETVCARVDLWPDDRQQWSIGATVSRCKKDK